jgi:hypothetical protein
MSSAAPGLAASSSGSVPGSIGSSAASMIVAASASDLAAN